LLEALGIFLGKVSGAPVRAGDFDLSGIAEHLGMRFEVVDEVGKVLAAGRELGEIREQLGVRAQENLDRMLAHPLSREEVRSWDFGDLPGQVEIQRYGMTLHAYPALVDLGKKVALRLFESAEAAAVAHRAGVRRLFIMQMGPDVKNLAKHVRKLEEASVLYTTIGPAEELRDNVLVAAADRALYSEGGEVRTRDAFIEHAQSGWRKLLLAANEITQIVLDTLGEAGAVAKLMEMPMAPAWRDARVDIRRQLAELLPRDFVMKTPPEWLGHLPRFVRAIRVRLEKLRDSGYNRDLAGLVQIGPMFQQYLERRAEHQRSGIIDPELEKYRWMLEELRVSLFAQELKTSMIISVQRMDRQWMLVRDG
jgi:ATP-dependent helicase HrpA